jgi:beta-glucanase (GH16 family)
MKVVTRWPPRPLLTGGWLIGLQVLMSFLGPGAAATAAPQVPQKCVLKVIDDFSSFPYLFNLKNNVTLGLTHPAAHSSTALPARAGAAGVLAASPSAADSAFVFGRRFPLVQNWSGGRGLSFWYFGRHTGKRITAALLGQQAADPGPSGWRLTWSDEFNGPAGTPPDPSIWNHETGDGSANGVAGWGNNELEYYTKGADNAALDGAGNLVITARKAPAGQNLSCYYGPCKYTSARLTTQNKFELAYGRVEARIRIPSGAGMWPAFWALGTNIPKVGWPKSGEIDIMENVGRQPNLLYGTIHGPGYDGSGIGGTYDASVDLAGGFHTYSIEWLPGKVSWAIDGITYFTATKQDAAPNPWVFDHPFFLLLNVAVGGNFGGPVAGATAFPQSMAVDYIRVYQAPDTAARFEASFADTFSGWRQITIPFTSFRRSAQQPAGAPAGKLNAKSIWGYSFTVPGGITAPVLLAKVQVASKAKGCTLLSASDLSSQS